MLQQIINICFILVRALLLSVFYIYWIQIDNLIESLKNNVIPPSAAGTITGDTTVCQNATNITYSIPAITGATSYVWTLPTGATGTSSTNSISVNFGSTATSGQYNSERA